MLSECSGNQAGGAGLSEFFVPPELIDLGEDFLLAARGAIGFAAGGGPFGIDRLRTCRSSDQCSSQ
jgi:hypothetical protein